MPFRLHQPGRDYITVRGFRLCQAATQWAAPTAEQIGLIGTRGSKGWIIENNVISDSKYSGVTLGDHRTVGQGPNSWRRFRKRARNWASQSTMLDPARVSTDPSRSLAS